MTTPLHSRILGPVRIGVSALAMVALVCLLAQGASAQDNDDDGVLPFAGEGASGEQTASGNNASGGTNSGEQLEMSPAILVAGDLEDGIDPAKATVEFATEAETTALVTDAPAEEAAFVANPPGICAGDNGTGPMLQASGQLHLHEGFEARFVAAQSSSKRVALLVIGTDGPSLEAELAGKSKPGLVVNLGDVASIDLGKLQAVTSKFAQSLPGYHATIVFVSVEAGVGLHTSAVRLHTAGGPIEVAVH